jgi:hypothetical protein
MAMALPTGTTLATHPSGTTHRPRFGELSSLTASLSLGEGGAAPAAVTVPKRA